MTNASSKKPTRNAYHVKDDPNGGNGYWIKIGAVLSHEDGKEETILLDALPIHFDGRITLRDREED